MIPTENVETRRLDGRNLVLMPYTAALVPTYHQWMQDPAMLELTGSEPLSLEQEYKNQISWGQDPTKYCFIIHSRRPVITTFREGPGVRTLFGTDYTLTSEAEAEALRQPVNFGSEDEDDEEENPEAGTSAEPLPPFSPSPDVAVATAALSSPITSSATAATSSATAAAASVDSSSTADSAKRSSSEPYPLTPIGDVNLFLYDDFNLEEYGIAGGGCEIEVMIAESAYRRRGLGLEAVQMLMEFSANDLGVERFVVKVLASNQASIDLFHKKLGFRLVEYVECFDEMVYFKDTSEVKPLSFGVEEADATAESQLESSSDVEASLTEPLSRLNTAETVTREHAEDSATTSSMQQHPAE